MQDWEWGERVEEKELKRKRERERELEAPTLHCSFLALLYLTITCAPRSQGFVLMVKPLLRRDVDGAGDVVVSVSVVRCLVVGGGLSSSKLRGINYK